jgi:hypothetical protein
MVIQKGDSVPVPEQSKPQRLLADWMQWSGGKPDVRFQASIKPIAASPGEDAGPGSREKDKKGEWVLTGKHELDAYLRDGKCVNL